MNESARAIVLLFIYKTEVEKNFTVFQQNKDCSASFLEEKLYILSIVPLESFGSLTMLFEEEEKW
jgi:hypothetical protein